MPNDDDTQELPIFKNLVSQIQQRRAVRRRAEPPHRMLNIFVVLCGIIALGTLAYLFRDSSFAAIPMVGLVIFIVLWPLYEKLQTLRRFTAEFEARKFAIHASAKDDELMVLQHELEKKKVQSKIAEADVQLRRTLLQARYETANAEREEREMLKRLDQRDRESGDASNESPMMPEREEREELERRLRRMRAEIEETEVKAKPQEINPPEPPEPSKA